MTCCSCRFQLTALVLYGSKTQKVCLSLVFFLFFPLFFLFLACKVRKRLPYFFSSGETTRVSVLNCMIIKVLVSDEISIILLVYRFALRLSYHK
uniref:Uncharacterized protein n=1 Tax=Daphnia magna TaxID=35525 RepID=A0A0P6HLQ8_9CRUS